MLLTFFIGNSSDEPDALTDYSFLLSTCSSILASIFYSLASLYFRFIFLESSSL